MDKLERKIINFFYFSLFCLLFFLVFYFFLKTKNNTVLSFPQSREVQEATLKLKVKSNFWFPNLKKTNNQIMEPKITARAGISYDLTTDKLLFAKNIKTKYPIASLTKIMTAIVAVENLDENNIIKINKFAVGIGEDSMGLSENEKFNLHDLIYGLILHSANDAAEAIASSYFNRNNFIYFMNKKAEDLGLSDTNFTNPTGLEGDGNQYSSAYDLLVISKNFLEKNFLREVAATFDYHIPYNFLHKEYYLENETNLITSYPGVKGIKTGYTDEAGYCLITYLEYRGHKIISVLLNSQDRRQEMKDILDFSLKSLEVIPPPHP